MYLTEKEIFSQYSALEKTKTYFSQNENRTQSFYQDLSISNILFIGCGSSYSLAKSCAEVSRLNLELPAYSYAAGDLLIHLERYTPILKNALLVVISRSGSTSEVIRLVELAQEKWNVPVVSICAKVDAPIAPLAGLNLDIPWAFDESVCQTRCVTNLYAACMLFLATLGNNTALKNAVHSVIAAGESYMADYREQLKAFASKEWNNVVVLADGELCGIAEEGALAFNEICLVPSHYYHLLDVRHGPIVLIDKNTLVIAAVSSADREYQEQLLTDIKKKGATLIVFHDQPDSSFSADCNVVVRPQNDPAAYGIPFIFISQALSLFKAYERGINPDAPSGLDAWIKL